MSAFRHRGPLVDAVGHREHSHRRAEAGPGHGQPPHGPAGRPLKPLTPVVFTGRLLCRMTQRK